jgi:hypothetical protein
MPLRLLRFATILLVAMLAGLAFAHVLERPAKMQFDPALYVTIQESLYVQWGPPHTGGVLEPAAILATGLLAFFLRKDRRGLSFALSALFGLLLAFPAVFFWMVAPANAAFLEVALPTIPPNWADLRSNWEPGHAIRFAPSSRRSSLRNRPTICCWATMLTQARPPNSRKKGVNHDDPHYSYFP